LQSSSAYRQQFESDDSTTSPRHSTQTSPTGPLKKQRGKGKKRRRDLPEKVSRKTRNKPAVPSPEPYIKPEPVSPPPPSFAALQPSRSRQYPSDVQVLAAPQRSYYQDAPPPVHYVQESAVASPNSIRHSSPAIYARPRRDDQDLRRVASFHAAHRPISPAPSSSATNTYRTVSQPYLERSSRYPEEAYRVPLAPQTQYLRSERSITPPHLRAARDPPMSGMLPRPPPPPSVRRIVVDQYGNRYYANESDRMSVAPQLRPEPEIIYERAPSRRQSVAYSNHPAPQQNGYEDEHEHTMRMPPPPPVRRVLEQQPDSAPTDYRVYRQRDYSRAPDPQYYRQDPTGPVYIRDAPAPAHSFGTCVYPPETHAPRAYSVRPEVEPVGYMSRQPSMVPPQTEYLRMMPESSRGSTMAPPPLHSAHSHMRAVSVIPAASNEYMTDQRYTAPAPAPLHASSTPGPGLRYVEEVGPTPAPPREIYVDQYGREVRRVGY
jgi:hypothetical protein